MPKKRVKNAFYFFMVDFKQEQGMKGINYTSMAEVAEAASYCWENAPAPVKAKYIDLAKKEKENNVVTKKLMSDSLVQQLMDRDDDEQQDIINIVKLKGANGDILHEDFYLMDVNVYCKISNGTQYLIAESTILRFNLKDGIKAQYHELINPGKIPVGYTFEAKMGGKEVGLELPDETQKRSNYVQILANVIDFLKKNDPSNEALPPLYTLPEKVIPITNFIFQMCSQASEDINIFRIYRLDTLFFTMVNALKTCNEEGFQRESQALAKLTNDVYKFFTPGMGCKVHDLADKTIDCTTTRVKCWAYKVLNMCCPMARLEMKIESHIPSDQHLDDIQIYKLRTRERAMPPIAGMYGPGSSNISVVSELVTEVATQRNVKKDQKTHEPVRMPKNNYTRSFVTSDITECNSASLTIGLGRGRGLYGRLSTMNINK